MPTFVELPNSGARQATAADLIAALLAQDVRASVPQANIGGPGGWLATILGFNPSAPNSNVINAISPNASTAVLAALRSSDTTNPGGMVPALNVFAINDNATALQTLYGMYIETHRYSGAGITQGIEVNMTNYGSAPVVTPYAFAEPGLTAAYWASAGRPDLAGANTNPSLVLGVPGGGSGIQYQSGIVFANGSLATKYAMHMPATYEILWEAPGGNTTGIIRSDSTANPGGGSIIFTDSGIVFETADNVVRFSIGEMLSTIGSLQVGGQLVVQAGQVPGTTVVQLPKSNLITWMNAAGTGYAANIRSDATTNGGSMIFADAGIMFQGSDGSTKLTIGNGIATSESMEITGLLKADSGMTLGGLQGAANNAAATALGVPVNGLYLLPATSAGAGRQVMVNAA